MPLGHEADEEYLLTTKLFCGKCGALMFGESGTSATGRTYYYYKCANVKRRKGCKKKDRSEALEIQKDELTAKIADEKLKKPSFNEDFIRFWLLKFRKFDISQKKQRKALIEIFVNAIFLYDDRMLITFNYKDGTQTVQFSGRKRLVEQLDRTLPNGFLNMEIMLSHLGVGMAYDALDGLNVHA